MNAPRSAPWRRAPHMSEWRYIVAAYVVTWVVLCGYALYARVRHVQARRRYDDEVRNGGGS